MSTHRIETLRWELRHPSARAALRSGPLQDRLARFLKSEGLRQIAARFDRHTVAGQVWRIDQLTLDLGRLSGRQTEQQWATLLDQALDLALLRARQRGPESPQPAAAHHHAVEQFLFYLREGHLPWGLSLPGRQAVSQWLAQLAQAHGRRLWQALQAHPAREALLARLSQVSPHHGLHALLAQRDPGLAEALQQLDDQALAPLQASGRLSAYQRERLQQSLRSAGLRALWGARGSGLSAGRRQELLQDLRQAMAEQLGQGWAMLLGAMAGPQVGLRPGPYVGSYVGPYIGPYIGSHTGTYAGQPNRPHSRPHRPMHTGSLAGAVHAAPAGSLLAELLAEAPAPTLARPDDAGTATDSPSRTWEAGLQQLREALSQPRRHSASHSARVATLLDRLAAAHPNALRSRLQHWAQARQQRRLWAHTLAPDNLGRLLAAMSQTRPATALQTAHAGPAGLAHLAPVSTAWQDSLRQTALRLQRQAPAAQRPGLSRLQALLMEASLQRVAEGQRLPDSHSAWQALWHSAWAQWLGETPAGAPRPGPPQPPQPESLQAPRPGTPPARSAPTPASAPSASSAPPAVPGPPAPSSAARARLDQALHHLAQQCREGRWAWPQRLRLARLLETEPACERWLQLFNESQRWQMLRAQFGPAAQALQQRAGRLQQWLGGLLREPLAQAQEHWRRLCRYLFVQGRSPEQAALRQHYQQQAQPGASAQATAATPPRAPSPTPPQTEPIWVSDAGQVLLAAYAERLFKQQGLLHEGRFIDARAQARAVQCLQTLCHGPGPVDEAQTVLSRLLCGLPPGALLPPVPPLEPETVSLLEQLLQAVIAHWKAVGNTSVAGLRESFLQREGRLQREKTPADEPPRWRLRVQTRGFDVLLDRLPWSFQTLKLPWMQGVLHVDWR